MHYAFVVLALGMLSVLGGQGFLRFGYAMILPSVKDALGLNFSQMGLLATSNYVGYVLGCAALAPAVARWGTRITVGVALLLVGVPMVLTGAVSNFELALVLQAIAGFGGAGAIAPSVGLVAAWFAPHRRGLGTGVMSAGGPLGSFITGPLVPMFVAMGPMGWRYNWYSLGTVVVLIAVLDLVLLRNRPSDIGLRPFGEDHSRAISGATATKGVADWRQLYRIPVVWHLAALAFASTLSAISYNTFFATYLMKERGLSPETSGYLWALVGAMGIVGGAIWGGFSDRVGRKPALVVAYLVTAACFGLFAGTNAVPLFALSAFFYGLTSRANFSIMAALSGDIVGPQLAGPAFGVNSLLAGVGMAAGPWLAGYIADVTSSFTIAFWGSAAVATAGAIGSLFIKGARVK